MVKNDVSLFAYNRFAGMNNVENDFRLPVTRDVHWRMLTDMKNIINMDINNSMVVSTRPGSDLKLAGADMHSLWSDGDILGLYIDGVMLNKLVPGYTSRALGAVGRHRTNYAQWNDRVYLTNISYIGFVQSDLLWPITDPGVAYKLPIPAGKFIAYYRGRLYLAKGKVLYISDALCDHYDIRTGFKVFENDITMLVAVDSGIYVSDGNTWFMSGGSPDELKREKVSDADAIPYTAVQADGKYIGEGLSGNGAIWTGTDGIYYGDGDGKVKNLTRSRYSMQTYGIGGAVLRNNDETVHYITTLE